MKIRASKKIAARVLAALLFAVMAVSTLQLDAQETALHAYVSDPDASYDWQLHGRLSLQGNELVELRMSSQTWRGLLWKHRVFLIKPAAFSIEQQASLVLVGGRWRDEYELVPENYALTEDVDLFVALAEALESIVVVLDLVPYQPLFDLTEDELIAHTLEQFLATNDADWPLLLPMVKSAVRAMDTGQTFARREWGADIEAFTVIGGSKRGWTAWLTGAVDARVNAIAPIVIDALNMSAHFPHQTEVWGAPSDEIRPYTRRNLHTILSEEQGEALRGIIDPYAYRARLGQPKLIVNATNDAYFPIDSINLYWPGLRAPKYALYLPNEGHSVEDYRRVIVGARALHRHAAGLEGLPRLSWTYRAHPESIELCVNAGRPAERLVVWFADSQDRDFRDESWKSMDMQSRHGRFVYEHARPAGGYSAIVAEAEFGRGEHAYSLSTTPAVIAAGGTTPRDDSMLSEGQSCFAE